MKHTPRKRFGQHFLHDRQVIQHIIEVIAVAEPVPIIEIGPGKGALTVPLLKAKGSLDVIEIDRDLAAYLKDTCRDIGRLQIHVADVLKFDLAGLGREKIKIVGNLPYNISTPLVFHLLKDLNRIVCMVFMMQKEVVDRICAEPDCADYGRLSVMVQSQCHVDRLFNIAPGSFTPPPKVESSLVRLTPKPIEQSSIRDRALFSLIVKQAFNQRRKTVRNSLKGLVDEETFARAGIASSARAENISVDDYEKLTNILHDTHR